jgi:peptidoglycan/LPS O-acetylase OafA/YrhL
VTTGERLVEVDALRGIAALAVLLFHYTTRYQQLYGGIGEPTLSFPHGHLGVNLFFVVSGFVIFMTLERTRRPLDFVVSRFSRLFPAYWTAIWITYAVTAAFGLPGKEVTLLQAAANMLMVHGFAWVPHVDGVYWTLEVELLFYCWMLGLFMLGGLRQVHRLLWALLAARLAYQAMAAAFGIDLPWVLSRLMILTYIPWFALGICVYQSRQRGDAAQQRRCAVTAVLALVCLAVQDGWEHVLLAATFALLVRLAADGRLRPLHHPWLVHLGAISYPLYLLHENIGWVALREMQARGVGYDASMLIVAALAIGLATLVHRLVEDPSLHWIRGRYRSALQARN